MFALTQKTVIRTVNHGQPILSQDGNELQQRLNNPGRMCAFCTDHLKNFFRIVNDMECALDPIAKSRETIEVKDAVP